MTAAEILAAHGILRAPEVVELAAAAKLELAAACVLLEKESGGGRNVWGSDAVPTGGSYDKGSEVVRSDYLAYRAARLMGTAGQQGCGPTQLTLAAFQMQADAAGGCWDWRANCLTGFRILASLIRAHGVRGGFRRYNGSGAAAERYADDAMKRLATWRTRLQEDDVALTDDEIKRIADAVWRRATVNGWGDYPSAETIIAATETRVAEILDRVQRIDALLKDV